MSSTNYSLLYVVNSVNKNDSQHFVHIPNLLSRLGTRGWNVRLVSEKGGRGEGEVSTIPVTYLSMDSRWSRLPTLLKTLLVARLRGNRLVFVRISKSSALVSGIAGRLFGWKTLYWLCGAVEDFNLREKGWRGRIEIAFLWILFRIVDHLVTGPETMRAYYRAYYGLSASKVVTLYNDVEVEPQVKRRPKAADAAARPNMLMVHRYSPVRETMRWFPRLLAMMQSRHELGKSVRFDVIGAGPELLDMKNAARAYSDLDLCFHGLMPNWEINAFYRRADLFVMPSYREGFPRVIIEAMAHGIPIVSTNAGGTSDLFGPHQAPYCFDRGDAEGFVNAADRLFDDVKLRERMAKENIEQAQRFSTHSVAQQYDETLRTILTSR